MTQKEYNNGVSLWADEVYRFAVHCGGGEELSKDAVQEAYASLWECRERIPVEKGKAYLLTVAHNHLMSHHRREQVYQRVLPQLTPAVSVAPDERFDLLRGEMDEMRNMIQSFISSQNNKQNNKGGNK